MFYAGIKHHGHILGVIALLSMMPGSRMATAQDECDGMAAENAETLVVRVVDGSGMGAGDPIRGAKVTVNLSCPLPGKELSGLTNGSGRIAFEEVYGPARIQVLMTEYKTAGRIVDLPSEDGPVEIALTPLIPPDPDFDEASDEDSDED